MKPYLIISFGMLIYAFAATGFLVPHKIVGGGATGLLLYYSICSKFRRYRLFFGEYPVADYCDEGIGTEIRYQNHFRYHCRECVPGYYAALDACGRYFTHEKFMSTIIAAMLTGTVSAYRSLLVEVPEVRISLRCW